MLPILLPSGYHLLFGDAKVSRGGLYNGRQAFIDLDGIAPSLFYNVDDVDMLRLRYTGVDTYVVLRLNLDICLPSSCHLLLRYAKVPRGGLCNGRQALIDLDGIIPSPFYDVDEVNMLRYTGVNTYLDCDCVSYSFFSPYSHLPGFYTLWMENLPRTFNTICSDEVRSHTNKENQFVKTGSVDR